MQSIFRQKENRNYTNISNAVFSSGLSCRAIGLLCYILHLPDDWRLYKTHLYKTLPEGKDAIKTAWVELEKKGFIVEKKIPAKKGKLPESHYIVFEKPQICAENPTELNSTIADFPQSETRHPKNPHLLNTKEQNTKQKTTKVSLSTIVDNDPHEDGRKTDESGNKKHEIVKTAKNKKEQAPKIFPKFMTAYYDWYKKNVGATPHITDVEGKNLKPIISYFIKITADKAKEDGLILNEASNNEMALRAWQYVLRNWDKLEPFYQHKMKISDINSNLSNIINNIRNGHPKSKQNGIVNSQSAHAKIHAMFNQQQ